MLDQHSNPMFWAHWSNRHRRFVIRSGLNDRRVTATVTSRSRRGNVSRPLVIVEGSRLLEGTDEVPELFFARSVVRSTKDQGR